MKGKLYLIPTPLTEMTDLTQIGKFVVDRVNRLSYFIVERSKTARQFIKACEHPVPQNELVVFELDKHAKTEGIEEFLRPLENGIDIGLLSEAGCPGIADPGAEVVRLAHQMNIEVIPLVGPSSLFLALMASGLNGQDFHFCGYPPVDKKILKQLLSASERNSHVNKTTYLFIETPYRNKSFYDNLVTFLQPGTRLCIAADITGVNEFIKTKTCAEWKKGKSPEIHKTPAIFLFQAG